MAVITVTEILGTDNVGLSRPIINENFKITKDAINNIENFLDTTPVNGTLEVGKVSIPLTGGSLNDVNFFLGSSGVVEGNLTVNESFLINPSTPAGNASFQVKTDGNVMFNQNNVIFTKNALNDNKVTFESNVILKGGIMMDLVSKSIIPGDYDGKNQIDPKKFSFDLGVTYQPLNVLNLDFVGTPGTTDVHMDDGLLGQILLLRIVEAPTGSFRIIGNINGDKTGSPTGILNIAGAANNDTLTLGYLSDGWVVLNKYGTLTIS